MPMTNRQLKIYLNRASKSKYGKLYSKTTPSQQKETKNFLSKIAKNARKRY